MIENGRARDIGRVEGFAGAGKGVREEHGLVVDGAVACRRAVPASAAREDAVERAGAELRAAFLLAQLRLYYVCM